MKITFISWAFIFVVSACKFSSQPKNNLRGTWKVIDYQNDITIPLSKQEIEGFHTSVKIQKQKMIEYSEYIYSDSTYLLKHSPVDSDKGIWEMPNDTTLILKSQSYRIVDTCNIHFTDRNNAVISMSDPTQNIKVYIQKK
ncbi:MAG: hypothetical protein LC105_04645 [Chitinophagales bacterium]|nr:hypothetical protein [Chitinophagales bacterium]MCZ2393131.1 hypothetical protein [Chitinophagales bacterium]